MCRHKTKWEETYPLKYDYTSRKRLQRETPHIELESISTSHSIHLGLNWDQKPASYFLWEVTLAPIICE